MGFIDRASAWSVLLPLGAVATLALAVVSAFAARALVLRLPPDLLEPSPPPLSRTRALLRVVAGVALVGAGTALLVLPGPGVLLIVLGALLLAPSWRARILRSIARRPRVLRELNALRRRHGCPEIDATRLASDR
jgi:hypothetical protein